MHGKSFAEFYWKKQTRWSKTNHGFFVKSPYILCLSVGISVLKLNVTQNSWKESPWNKMSKIFVRFVLEYPSHYSFYCSFIPLKRRPLEWVEQFYQIQLRRFQWSTPLIWANFVYEYLILYMISKCLWILILSESKCRRFDPAQKRIQDCSQEGCTIFRGVGLLHKHQIFRLI